MQWQQECSAVHHSCRQQHCPAWWGDDAAPSPKEREGASGPLRQRGSHSAPQTPAKLEIHCPLAENNSPQAGLWTWQHQQLGAGEAQAAEQCSVLRAGIRAVQERERESFKMRLVWGKVHCHTGLGDVQDEQTW